MANTLAYYDMATITSVKSFIVQAPGLPFAGRLRPYSQILDQAGKAGQLITKIQAFPAWSVVSG